jgi:hypothetical protein
MVGNLNSNPYLHQQALRSRWPRNDNSRRLNVAILGIPNSGKSTLINKAHARFFFLKTVSCAFFGRLGKNTGYSLRGKSKSLHAVQQILYLSTAELHKTRTSLCLSCNFILYAPFHLAWLSERYLFKGFSHGIDTGLAVVCVVSETLGEEPKL